MGVHSNISFFIPHLGCTNRCSFCNQCSITGQTYLTQGKDIKEAVEIAVKSKKYSKDNTEIAFFGGSFTAIDKEYMISLLESAYPYVMKKIVKGIRISTRPDAIDDEVLTILKKYGVSAIELGAQSMDDEVLLLNERGHTASDVINASMLIKKHGFSLGLQMMTGLYGATPQSDKKTVENFIKISPDTVRIYPTVVLYGTKLEDLVKSGKYLPEDVETAVNNCCDYINLFEENNINVIRVGLHHIDENSFVAGPWHPAFSELCMSKRFLKNILKELENKQKGDFLIFVNDKYISAAVGQKRVNILKLKEKGFNCRIKGDKNLTDNEFRIEREVK